MNRVASLPSELCVAVDFDWTLSDTTAFVKDLENMLARDAGLEPATVNQDLAGFHLDPLLGGYLFEDHVAAYGLNVSTMWKKLERLLEEKNYLYSDSEGFLNQLFAEGYEPRILSFGEQRYQQLKIAAGLGRLSSPARDLAYDITDQKKARFIAEVYPGRHGVLVDDVPNQALPEGFCEVQIDRSRTLDVPTETAQGYIVSNLTQALQVIRSL